MFCDDCGTYTHHGICACDYEDAPAKPKPVPSKWDRIMLEGKDNITGKTYYLDISRGELHELINTQR